MLFRELSNGDRQSFLELLRNMQWVLQQHTGSRQLQNIS